jgi:hypothetical protein
VSKIFYIFRTRRRRKNGDKFFYRFEQEKKEGRRKRNPGTHSNSIRKGEREKISKNEEIAAKRLWVSGTEVRCGFFSIITWPSCWEGREKEGRRLDRNRDTKKNNRERGPLSLIPWRV